MAEKAKAAGKGVRYTIRIPKPNPKQEAFLEAKEKYVCFGGARGGGKSWAVRVKAIQLALRYPGIRLLILRSTYPELMSNHIRPLRGMIPEKVASYNGAEKTLRFYNGSLILFGHCGGEGDLERYQGNEFEGIFIDEATNHTEEVFQKLTACLRSTSGYPVAMYLTCNPGGKGHGWVKRLFIDRKFREGEKPEQYRFIQSLLTDNLALMKAQPDYIDSLRALPDKLREAWLHGNWNLFEGQFFEELRLEKTEGDRFTHVIAPFQPPRSWKRLRSYDWGYSRPFSCAWWAVDHEGRLYRILELYGCTKHPNEGVKWTTEEQFAKIARIEREHPYLAGHHIEGVADPSIWSSNGGVSTAEVAARHQVYFRPGDNKRIPGWMQVHYRLRFDEEGLPMLYVFENCKAFLRTMPLLCYDPNTPEDLDTSGEDHVADEVRYMCMLNPMNPPPKERKYPAEMESPFWN